MLIDEAANWQFQVSECEQLVITHEMLARQIAHLLLTNGGVTRNMTDEAFASYRQLALRRDMVWHMIQVMEYNLSNE